MKVTGIPIVVGALEIVSKNQEKRLEELDIIGGFETIWITTSSWDTLKGPEWTRCHSDYREKPFVIAGVKTPRNELYIYIYIYKRNV